MPRTPSRARPRRFTAIAVVLAGALLATGALAQWGVASSLYTQDGVEIAVDARVFSVFAMLNGLGYDVEGERGPPPLYRPRFSEAREQARSRLGRPGPAMEALAKIVEQHPVEPVEYARAALRLGQAPKFEAPKDAPKLAKELSKALRGWYNEEGGALSFRAVAPTTTKVQKRLLEPIDELCTKLAASARLGSEEDQILDDTGPEGRIVVVVNELDAHGTLFREEVGDLTYIVTGPRREKDDLRPVVHAAGLAFARTLLAREVEKHAKPGTLADLYAALPAEQKKALGDAKGFVTELLACAMVKRAAPGARCVASPLDEESDALRPVFAALDERLAEYAKAERLLPEAMPELIAPLPEASAEGEAPAPEASAGASVSAPQKSP